MKTIVMQNKKTKMLKYYLFILFSAFFTSTVLLLYSYQLKGLVPSSNLTREYCICFGQIFFQGSLLLLFKTNKSIVFEYLRQMMVVSFIGALLLTPALISAFIFYPFTPGSIYFLAYFMAIVVFMFFNHKKRVEKTGAPKWLSYTWVLYRLIVLIIIL